jgi:hypothetical protein
MKNLKSLIVILISFVALMSCKSKSPIWDREPVDKSFSTGFPLDQFHRLGEDDDTVAQKTLVNQHRKQLTKNVMSHYPCVTDEKNVKFVFGSGSVKGLLSGDGKHYDGKFKNELIIIVNDPCKEDTVFLACGNGMLSSIHWSRQSNWGTAEKCRFVVEKGQSLAYFLPRLENWGVKAEELGLPIADSKGKIVDSKIYMAYLGKWWSDHLFPGDVIDLCEKKITNSAGQKVNFERRLTETKKANLKILQKRIREISKLNLKGKSAKLEQRKRLKKLRSEYNLLRKQN